MKPTSGSLTVVTGGTILEARDLVLSFGETPALRGANLSVQRGEVLAIMGPSGSGKSTLLHCLAGILVPDAGRVEFDGRRLDTLRESERSKVRRDRFGFVFQFGQLVPELTAEEYLDTQRAAHLQRMRELTEFKHNGGIVETLLAGHGLFHLEADLRWIDLTAARLTALAEVVAA